MGPHVPIGEVLPSLIIPLHHLHSHDHVGAEHVCHAIRLGEPAEGGVRDVIVLEVPSSPRGFNFIAQFSEELLGISHEGGLQTKQTQQEY